MYNKYTYAYTHMGVYVYKSWERGYLCVRVLIIELVDQNLDKIYLFNFDRIAFLTRNMATPL